jgi:hypothetical protein
MGIFCCGMRREDEDAEPYERTRLLDGNSAHVDSTSTQRESAAMNVKDNEYWDRIVQQTAESLVDISAVNIRPPMQRKETKDLSPISVKFIEYIPKFQLLNEPNLKAIDAADFDDKLNQFPTPEPVVNITVDFAK